MHNLKKHAFFPTLLSLCSILCPLQQGMAQDETFSLEGASRLPKYETRAVWITTLSGLDWPRTQATSPATRRRQQEELCRQLDSLQAANFNTILLQVRSRDNALYPSKQEVFTDVLTGTLGQSPGYDPLEFAIRECHKRGMELHAWVVAIPLGSDKQARQLGSRSFVRKHPEMCVRFRQNWYLDPGHPQTKEHLADIVREIVSRYDVDGINLDYIRYPDRPKGFPDQRSYRKYGKGKSLAQWRRDNITAIVRRVYETVKAVKPWVKVGSSPIGKHEDVARYSSRGWNARSVVFQDAQQWVKEGIQDLMFPMAYFREDSFYPFVLDWQENANGRTVVPGLGIYFLDPSEGNWELQDVLQQIYFTRCTRIPGQAYFRARFLLDDTQGLFSTLKKEIYTCPALVPPMTWLDSIPPTMPTGLQTKVQGDSLVLTWNPVTENNLQPSPTPAMRYNLYASQSKTVDTKDPHNLKRAYIYGTRHALPLNEAQGLHFTLTAVDAYGNESRILQAAHPAPPAKQQATVLKLPECPQATRLTITDLYGRTVWQEPYSRQLTTTRFAPGVYYVHIQDKDGHTLIRIQFTC